jgi:hypothetical protein
MKKYPYILFALLLLGCKKKDFSDTGGYNCALQQEVKADFMMGELWGDEFIELDTIAMPIDYGDGTTAQIEKDNLCHVHFKAKLDGATYEWQVGNNGTVQTTKSFSLQFSYRVGTIPVRLIVHKTPNPYCFPNDDGVDTVTKYLTITNVEPHPYFGKFKGYCLSKPEETFTIQIDTTKFNSIYYPINTGHYVYARGVKNLPNGNNGWSAIASSITGGTTLGFINQFDPAQIDYGYNSTGQYIFDTKEYPSTYTEDQNFANFTRGRYYPDSKKMIIFFWYRKILNAGGQLGPKMGDVFVGYKQ